MPQEIWHISLHRYHFRYFMCIRVAHRYYCGIHYDIADAMVTSDGHGNERDMIVEWNMTRHHGRVRCCRALTSRHRSWMRHCNGSVDLRTNWLIQCMSHNLKKIWRQRWQTITVQMHVARNTGRVPNAREYQPFPHFRVIVQSDGSHTSANATCSVGHLQPYKWIHTDKKSNKGDHAKCKNRTFIKKY